MIINFAYALYDITNEDAQWQIFFSKPRSIQFPCQYKHDELVRDRNFHTSKVKM